MVSMLPGVLSWQFLNVNLALWHPYVEPVQVAGCPGDIYGFKAAYSRMDLTMVVYLAALTLMLQSLKFLQ